MKMMIMMMIRITLQRRKEVWLTAWGIRVNLQLERFPPDLTFNYHHHHCYHNPYQIQSWQEWWWLYGPKSPANPSIGNCQVLYQLRLLHADQIPRRNPPLLTCLMPSLVKLFHCHSWFLEEEEEEEGGWKVLTPKGDHLGQRCGVGSPPDWASHQDIWTTSSHQGIEKCGKLYY